VNHKPLINLPVENYAPAFFHCISGIVTRICNEILETNAEFIRLLFKNASKHGKVEVKLYHNGLTGNAARAILNYINETDDFDQNTMPAVEQFRLLCTIQSLLRSDWLDEIDFIMLEGYLNDLADYMNRYLTRNYINKEHYVINHFLSFLRNFGSLGLFSEQGGEHLHKVMAKDRARCWGNVCKGMDFSHKKRIIPNKLLLNKE
jgi:hypothetical protein